MREGIEYTWNLGVEQTDHSKKKKKKKKNCLLKVLEKIARKKGGKPHLPHG